MSSTEVQVVYGYRKGAMPAKEKERKVGGQDGESVGSKQSLGAAVRAAGYVGGQLSIGGVGVEELAERFGTPLYVYNEEVLRAQYGRVERALQQVAPHLLVCYALKANANPTLGRTLAELGAGADVVSGGEIYLAQRMGFAGEKTVFAGVGKTRREMAEGLEAGIRVFHVESAGELEALAAVAESRGQTAPVAVRVNPDIEAGTHPYITTGTRANKFGVSPEEAQRLVRIAERSRWLNPVGLHAHIGSQLPKVAPAAAATALLLELADRLASDGIALREIDIGGGLGISYRPAEMPEGPEELAAALAPLLKGREELRLVVEPGRFIVGPAGALITRVLYTKPPSTIIVDAGMNDLLRPALYGAWHPVWPLHESDLDTGEPVDVAGPVCESADVLAMTRRLGRPREGSLLVIGQAGAYGYSMASQYNARPRAAEVLVTGSEARLIRARESYADLWPGEPE
jgi:diaminopimelate decarboxylase